MRAKLRIGWLLAACLIYPLHSRAQSLKSSNFVSVRELGIPANARHAFEQGVILLDKKDAAGSLPHFESAIAGFANYYEAYYKMGVAYLKLSRVTDAQQGFQKSIDLSGAQYAPPLFALGAILDSRDKFGEAEGVIRKGLDLDPTAWSGHYSLGWALFGLNRLEEAEKSVRAALSLKTDSTEALRLLADIHSREKDYAALLNDLDEYLKLDPISPTGIRIKALRESAQRALVDSQSSSALAVPQN